MVIVSFTESRAKLVGLYRRLGFDLNMLEAQNLFLFLDGIETKDVGTLVDGFKGKRTRALVAVMDIGILEALGRLLDAMDLVKSIEKTGLDLLLHFHSPSSTQYQESCLWRWLCHRSTICLFANPLASGLSKEFHGELIVRDGGRSHLRAALDSSSLLYRSTETAVFFTKK